MVGNRQRQCLGRNIAEAVLESGESTRRHSAGPETNGWTSPLPVAAPEGRIFGRAGNEYALKSCQGQRHRLFPPPLRLQNQFYNFACSTPASQSLCDIVANRF